MNMTRNEITPERLEKFDAGTEAKNIVTALHSFAQFNSPAVLGPSADHVERVLRAAYAAGRRDGIEEARCTHAEDEWREDDRAFVCQACGLYVGDVNGNPLTTEQALARMRLAKARGEE